MIELNCVHAHVFTAVMNGPVLSSILPAMIRPLTPSAVMYGKSDGSFVPYLDTCNDAKMMR